MDETGGEGKLRTRAKYLVPNNPQNQNEFDYNFNENTKISNFSEYNTNKVYDFIVIGSGPGGSISSYYLNKRFNGNGLLIEKGRAFNLYKSKHPGDEFLYKWKNGGVNSTILPLQVQFASGECLGGGSEINSGLYHKPDQDFISKWKKNDGIVNLEINELKEKLSELEKIINFTKEFDKNKTGSHEFFLKGAKEKNYSTEEVPIFQTINDNNKESTKNTMSNSFIKKYLEEDKISFCQTCRLTESSKRTYDTKRIPSWCDRILYRDSRNIIKSSDYSSFDLSPDSDHLAVYNMFELAIKATAKNKNV